MFNSTATFKRKQQAKEDAARVALVGLGLGLTGWNDGPMQG